MSIKIDISFSKDFENMDKLLDKVIQRAITRLSPILERYGKQNHRYKNRSGNLTSQTNVSNIGLDLIAENLADYAEYIIKGHGSWAPDPFIESIITDNENLIIRIIEEEITKELG